MHSYEQCLCNTGGEQGVRLTQELIHKNAIISPIRTNTSPEVHPIEKHSRKKEWTEKNICKILKILSNLVIRLRLGLTFIMTLSMKSCHFVVMSFYGMISNVFLFLIMCSIESISFKVVRFDILSLDVMSTFEPLI